MFKRFLNVNRYLILLLLLLAKSGFAGDNPYIRHYGISDGLLTNTIYHVSQDREGFLWFSTDAGVVKYNGTAFSNFRKRDGLTDKEILWTKEDSQGRVWISSFKGNINFYYKNKIYNWENTDYLREIDSKEFIIGIYEDTDKTIFFYTVYGHIYSVNTKNEVNDWQLPIKERLYYISTTSDDKMLVVKGNGIFISDGLNADLKLFKPMDILNVYPADSGVYCVITNNYELLKFRQEKLLATYKNPLFNHNLITVLTDNTGLMWVGNFDRGVYCMKDDQVLFNIPVNQPQMIFQDMGNNIWITSMKEAIVKIHPGFTSIKQFSPSSFGDNGISAVCRKGSEDVWIASANSIFYYHNGKIQTFYQGETNSFIDIITEFNNELWFGKKSDAFYAIKLNPKSNAGDEYRQISAKPKLINSFIKGFSMSRNHDEICIQHINDLYFYRTDRPLATQIHANERVYSTHYNPDHQLIISSINGISRWMNDTLTHFNELNKFDGKRIDDHLIINDTMEVFNIEGDSLWLLADQNFYNLTSGISYPIRLPIVKPLYHEPFLYFTTTNKIYRLMIPTDFSANSKIDIQPIDIRFNSIHDALFQNDTLFIASEDGLTLISPNDFNKFSNKIISPYFTNIQAEEKKLDFEQGKEIVLRGNSDLHIDFDAINYSESPIIYSYKLEGLEVNWNTGQEISVVYKNLSPGIYTFKLRARSFSTDWSKPIHLVVRIQPAFYQRTVFIIGCLVIMLALMHFVSRRYIRRLKKSQELKTKLITYEQKALQSMMNPHFIFNSLGSIQNYLLQNKSNEASMYLSQFARLIRQNLNSANSTYISIEDETDRLMNYLSLEKLRLDDKFDFQIKVAPDIHTDEVLIPSMIIQPFVENAVWHGISPMNEKGEIIISFKKETEETLMISIEDNGVGMKQSSQYFNKNNHISIGMETTQKRLNLICKQQKLKFELEFSEVLPGNPLPGTRISFIIPVRCDNDFS